MKQRSIDEVMDNLKALRKAAMEPGATASTVELAKSVCYMDVTVLMDEITRLRTPEVVDVEKLKAAVERGKRECGVVLNEEGPYCSPSSRGWNATAGGMCMAARRILKAIEGNG